MTPTFGGLAMFGQAVNMHMTPNANAAQIAAFFGVFGVQSLDGGQRGRIHEVTGLMVGATPALVQANEIQWEQFATGISQLLIDTTGLAWPNTVYRNEFSWDGRFLLIPAQGLWCRSYRLILHGLT